MKDLRQKSLAGPGRQHVTDGVYQARVLGV